MPRDRAAVGLVRHVIALPDRGVYACLGGGGRGLGRWGAGCVRGMQQNGPDQGQGRGRLEQPWALTQQHALQRYKPLGKCFAWNVARTDWARMSVTRQELAVLVAHLELMSV